MSGNFRTEAANSSLVIGVTGDLISPDGSYLFPDYSLEPLSGDDRITMDRIPCVPDLPPDVLTRVDILVSVPMGMAIKRQSLRCATRTVAIVRVGVGYEDVDVDAMTEAGVALVIPSPATRRPTAVAAFTLILALATRLLDKHQLTLAGPDQWSRRCDLRGIDLEGLTLGLIGCGHIGQDLISLVKPFGLHVLVSDPAVSTEQAYLIGVEPVSLDDLLSRSDFVSLHCPLNSKTRHLIDERRLSLMKSSAYLVNTARGGLVDQAALATALCANRIAGAGLDVLEPEPPEPDDPILKCGNVVFSAHALNWTKGLDAALSRANVDSIRSILQGQVPTGLVNPAVTDNPLFQAKLRRLGASVQDQNRRSWPNRISS